MKKLIIDRSRWIRGEGASESRLQRHGDGKQCCAGQFAAKVLGVPEVELIGKGSLEQVESTDVPPWMCSHTDWITSSGPVTLQAAIYSLNDIVGVPDELREPWIAAAFAMGGIEVEFVDGPVPS